MKTTINFLESQDDNLHFKLFTVNDEIIWRCIAYSENDGNPSIYAGHLSNDELFYLYKKLEKYYEGAKYIEVINTINERYYVLEN